MTTAPFRRIVTGHNAAGKSIIEEAAPAKRIHRFGGVEGIAFYEIWSTRSTPALIERAGGEPVETSVMLPPPKNGTRIRVNDFPPSGNMELSAEEVHDLAQQIGAAGAFSSESRHPMMHRLETVDYGIVLEGEIVLLMDEGEVTARAGDIIIQRGTNHAWINRTAEMCRMAFIAIDGEFADGLN